MSEGFFAFFNVFNSTHSVAFFLGAAVALLLFNIVGSLLYEGLKLIGGWLRDA